MLTCYYGNDCRQRAHSNPRLISLTMKHRQLSKRKSKRTAQSNWYRQTTTDKPSHAERAIQTFKNHFKAVIAGVDDNLPMHLWDRLLPQTVLTLNLLRQSNVAPTVSAYQYIHGAFDYNKMPLAPMGCAVQIHERSERRGSWAMNSRQMVLTHIRRTLQMP